jgi:hypothetical protein
MVMKFGAGRNKPHVRTQLDAALNFYHADGGGRDLFITMAQAGKTTEQKIQKVNANWASQKNFNIISNLPQEPEPAPHLKGAADAIRLSTRHRVVPRLEPEPKPKTAPPRTTEPYERKVIHHLNGLPQLPVAAATFPPHFETSNQKLFQVRTTDPKVTMSRVPGYQGFRPGASMSSSVE